MSCAKIENCGANYVGGKLLLSKVAVEPSRTKWEKELMGFYKTILEKFDCLDDPLMGYEADLPDASSESDESSGEESGDGSSDDSSDDDNSVECDLVTERWAEYGIDIWSKDAIAKFEKMGMPILESKELDKCTFSITDENGMVQCSYRCTDCFPTNSTTTSICEFCIEDCKKKGHNISKPKYVPGYCDKQLGM